MATGDGVGERIGERSTSVVLFEIGGNDGCLDERTPNGRRVIDGVVGVGGGYVMSLNIFTSLIFFWYCKA